MKIFQLQLATATPSLAGTPFHKRKLCLESGKEVTLKSTPTPQFQLHKITRYTHGGVIINTQLTIMQTMLTTMAQQQVQLQAQAHTMITLFN